MQSKQVTCGVASQQVRQAAAACHLTVFLHVQTAHPAECCCDVKAITAAVIRLLVL